jgi:hypothetical protein
MGEEKCQKLATIRRFWPGSEPDLICVDHAEDSERIADAMGFHLHMEPIGYSASAGVPAAFPTCCCSKGFSQTVSIERSEP